MPNAIPVSPTSADISIKALSDMVIYTNFLHPNSLLRLKELEERIPMDGQVGQVLVWTASGPSWQNLPTTIEGENNNE